MTTTQAELSDGLGTPAYTLAHLGYELGENTRVPPGLSGLGSCWHLRGPNGEPLLALIGAERIGNGLLWETLTLHEPTLSALKQDGAGDRIDLLVRRYSDSHGLRALFVARFASLTRAPQFRHESQSGGMVEGYWWSDLDCIYIWKRDGQRGVQRTRGLGHNRRRNGQLEVGV